MPDGTIFGIGEAGREHYAAAPQEEKEIWKEAGKEAGKAHGNKGADYGRYKNIKISYWHILILLVVLSLDHYPHMSR